MKQGAPPHDASSFACRKRKAVLFSAGKRPFRRYTVLRQPISYFCLMKSPRPSLAEKAAGKGVFGLSGRIL